MSNDRFDETFDRLWERALQDSEEGALPPVPAPEISWLRMREKLERERRLRKWRRTFKWAAVTAASLGLGAVLFHSLQTTEAFRSMYEMVYKKKGTSVSIHAGSTYQPDPSKALTPPPPPDDGPPPPPEDNHDLPDEGAFRRVTVTLEQAYREAQFSMPVLGYLPEGYELKEAVVHYSMGETKGSAVRLIYEDQGSGKQLKVLFRKRAFSSIGNMPDGQRAKSDNKSGIQTLEWNDNDINIYLQGEISGQDLEKLASGLSRP
ncbi:DUF4367 domain-containing protein [Paenibacillus thalictri]|uniref:DUF4367 domain-containing protein n=1 Tax=Paenibacillus thalictri TaxID=2527873 RepID=A0A4Q9DRE5_9BACL|nr:DUF4367 domain-containing protein [Paenibacillus thalictri]TBL78201.1 hypothetical protein EYB31_15080 [Paenibacillus thalictri]